MEDNADKPKDDAAGPEDYFEDLGSGADYESDSEKSYIKQQKKLDKNED